MHAECARLFDQLRKLWRAQFFLSQVLFALDDATEALEDIFAPGYAIDLAAYREQILQEQHRLHHLIERLQYRLCMEIQNSQLP